MSREGPLVTIQNIAVLCHVNSLKLRKYRVVSAQQNTDQMNGFIPKGVLLYSQCTTVGDVYSCSTSL